VKSQTLGHSVAYLAKKARDKEVLKQKRKERDERLKLEKVQDLKRKREADENKEEELRKLKVRVLEEWGSEISKGTEVLYREMYGDVWASIKAAEEDRLQKVQREEVRKREMIEKHERGREEAKFVALGDGKRASFKDDVDAGY